MDCLRKAASGALAALIVASFAVGASFIVVTGCDHDDDNADDRNFSSRAYKGHASDADINNFVRVYPWVYGTRLDDCQTCHKSGVVQKPKGGGYKDIQADVCTFCHYIEHPMDGWLGLPTTFWETLNEYGKDYMLNGKNLNALVKIDQNDSDGDGFTNREEIDDVKYPGDAGSMPGQALCPVVTVTLNQVRNDAGIAKYDMFLLSNTSKQQFDNYANYKGVRMKDFIKHYGGLDLELDGAGVEGIHVVAPDGYSLTFDVDKIADQFPPSYFFDGFGVNDLGECAFVDYPAQTHGYSDGETIVDEMWHLLAYERDGSLLDKAYLDDSSGKIGGEGPFRNVIPPWMANLEDSDCSDTLDPKYVMHPDWGLDQDKMGCTEADTYPYDECKCHNAGDMAKGAVVIRVMPMPEGCEEFDINNGGWALIQENKILLYGYGIQTP